MQHYFMLQLLLYSYLLYTFKANQEIIIDFPHYLFGLSYISLIDGILYILHLFFDKEKIGLQRDFWMFVEVMEHLEIGQ